jgi:hypothetical protein
MCEEHLRKRKINRTGSADRRTEGELSGDLLANKLGVKVFIPVVVP